MSSRNATKIFTQVRTMKQKTHRLSQKWKSADSKGMKAEDIKGAYDKTINMIRELFIMIITRTLLLPTHGKTVITVIYKKEDGANPENYRPICGFQQLYKQNVLQPTQRRA